MSAVIPKVSSISSRIIRVLGCNPSPMTLQGTNTYVIGTGQKRILLDTGNPGVSEYLNLLRDVLQQQNCSLQNIIVSHWHLDHVGGVPEILKELNQNCIVSKLPLPSGSSHPSLASEIKYNFLQDGDIISAEGATLKVFSTPGHTEDHLVLYLEEENSLFSGDCILGEGTAVFEDFHDYMQSLEKILKLDPKKIYPGHGPVIDNPKKKIIEYMQHRMQREQQILDVLKKPASSEGLTAEELVHQIYVETPVHLLKAAERNVFHHLNKLVKGNTVGEIKGYKVEDTKYFLLK